MVTRSRLVGALLAVVVPAALGLTTLPASAAASATPPSCASDDPSSNCVHAPTPDITALPAPAVTTTYNPRTHLRTITFVAAINPPHPTCPDGGVPYADIPCSFRGLAVSARVYLPGAKEAALLTGATPPANTPCDFTCTVTATFGGDLHGPATVILKFGIGDLIVAANDLSGSSYETTIELPAVGTAGLLHPLKPQLVYSGKLASMTLQLAGKAGVPTAGVGGVLVDLVSSSQEANIQGGDQVCCNVGSLEVVPGTRLRVHKVLPGSLTVRVVGWYGKTPQTTGSLFHRLLGPRKMKVAPVISLRSAGVPPDASAAVVAVVTTTSNASVAGIPLPKRAYPRYVVAPLKAGAQLAVKTGKGTKVIVYGYLEPVHPVDEGLPIPVPQVSQPQQLSQIFGLPDTDTIY